ncbi:hypothetical protein OS188_12960 [Xanthomarina sp. F1114]|uniref:hypothetical protein n=1 Tax=Xanthomarina sp. F1114 TaxID=2996019 RepID=UPI00225E4AF4|nr:hypothetical protein [Xanthomarina sp. F1114]MCX7548863.1 hypothetical protein [Xanthomarina sp. F1114]
MPNRTVRNAFQKKGYNINHNPYCQFDTIANSEDLIKLFSVLSKYKDKDGNHPMITANTVVANPDFDEIRDSDFKNYSYKPFTTTLNEYYPHQNVFELWKDGIEKKVFIPQFHGREHLNVPLWLELLRGKEQVLIDAFDMGFWGVPKELYDKNIINIQAAYGSAENESIDYYKNTIREGLDLFESIFNYKSTTFIANNYTWSPKLHTTLKEKGVIGFQGMKYQKIPIESSTDLDLYPAYTGKRNDLGQVYMVRNCVFEPSQMNASANNVKNCLRDMEIAFLFKKPAIIASHRLNFIGAINPDNRDQNLIMLDKLLTEILRKWPDVKFKTSNQLADNLYVNG